MGSKFLDALPGKQKENISQFFQMTTCLGAEHQPANRGQCAAVVTSAPLLFHLSFFLYSYFWHYSGEDLFGFPLLSPSFSPGFHNALLSFFFHSLLPLQFKLIISSCFGNNRRHVFAICPPTYGLPFLHVSSSNMKSFPSPICPLFLMFFCPLILFFLFVSCPLSPWRL